MSYRERFFNKKVEFLTLEEILKITGSTLKYDHDLNLRVYNVATLKNGTQEQLSFLNSGQYFNQFQETKAGFCLINEDYAEKTDRQDIVLIINKNPYYAYSQLVSCFYEENISQFKEKNISSSAKIGKNCNIASSAFIGKNVEIGDNCVIYPNANILDNSIIGDNTIIGAGATISFAIIGQNCYIYSGVRIGQDGFGFAHNKGINHKILQIGIVEIQDNVEIGANSCVDRGAIENTVIGEGTKIDNLVQIAHNVTIGQGTVIAGCSAIAGSAEIGNYVQIGGNSSIAGHIKISDGAKVAGMTGVTREVEPMTSVAGIPALPIRQFHRITSELSKLSKPQRKS